MCSGKRWVDTAKILCSVVYVGWVQVGVGVDKSETLVGGLVQTLVGLGGEFLWWGKSVLWCG